MTSSSLHTLYTIETSCICPYQPKPLLYYLQDGLSIPRPSPLQHRPLVTNHTARIQIAMRKFKPIIIVTKNLPTRPVIRILCNSLPWRFLRRGYPEIDRAPPQDTLPALLPLIAKKHQMFPHHRDYFHDTKPLQRALQMGRPFRTERSFRMAETRTSQQGITVVTS